jgi:hypothetical protein
MLMSMKTIGRCGVAIVGEAGEERRDAVLERDTVRSGFRASVFPLTSHTTSHSI